MANTEDLGSFFKESKPVFKEYMETRLEIFRLQAVRMISQSAGYLIWILISLFLLLLIFFFAGMALAYWLSSLMNSYVAGFGVTTLIMIGLFVLFALFRNSLFVNPLMKTIIRKTLDDIKID